jgi:hypothetical protein
MGGMKVNDRAVSLLEQYDLEVLRTRKGRGAILCETSNGLYIFKEYEGSLEKCIGELPDYNDLDVLKNDLLYKTKEEVENFIEDNIDPY